jgi:hypothetical protein
MVLLTLHLQVITTTGHSTKEAFLMIILYVANKVNGFNMV